MAARLIERAHELDRLDGVCRDVRAGRGSFVHIVGEAGIGKTSLLRIVAAKLPDSAVTVMAAAADETDRRRPLALLRRLLPRLQHADSTDAIDEALAIVEQHAAVGPTAVLIDDLHWADDGSLDVLWALARRATDLGVALVTTSWPSTSSGALGRLEELAIADETCLRPAPFDHDGLATLVEQQLGAPPGPRLSTALDGTAGNPFLAVELLAALATDGVVTNDGRVADLTEEPPVPETLSRRLATRTLGAVPGAELLLRTVAAVPGGARADELAELFERPLGETVGLLIATVEAGVLVDAGGSLTFRHDLLRRAVLGATPGSLSRSLARRFADVLLHLRADPDRVASCWLAAADPDDPIDVDRVVSIARGCRSTHPAAAADLFALAVGSLDGNNPAADGLVAELGWALVAAGRSAEVGPLLAEQFGPYRESEPIEVHRLRGIAASLSGHLDLVAARYADLDVDQLSAHYDVDDPEVVDAFAELGLLRVSAGQLADASQVVDWVDSSATEVSPFRAATVATVRAFLAATSGAFELAADQARTALEAVARDHTRRASSATPTLVLAIALDMLGDSEGALAATRRGARHATPRWGAPMLQSFATVVLYRRGDWDDALAEVDASLLAAEEAQLAMAVFWPSAVATLVSCARDHSGRAHEWSQQSHRLGGQPSLGSEWLALAAAAVAETEGDPARSLTLVELLVAGVTTAGAPAMLLNGAPEMVRQCRHGGRPDLVRSILTALEEVTSRTASPVARALLTWSRALGHRDVEAIIEAADQLVVCHRIPEAARAMHHAAVGAAAGGRSDEARRHAKPAFEYYESLGAEHWRRQLIADLRSTGVDVRPRRRRPRHLNGWESLTASEEAVVALVGEGCTNTAIAERLFVSRRTVESHLGRVYTKVGLSTRAQLVATTVRRQSHDDRGQT